MVIYRRPTVTGELKWPARLWKVETVELIDERDRSDWDRPDQDAYVRAREVVVLDELPVSHLLGPKGQELAALFSSILELTSAEAEAFARTTRSTTPLPPVAQAAEETARLAEAVKTIAWRLVFRRARQVHGVNQFPFDPYQQEEVLPAPWEGAAQTLAARAAALACGADLSAVNDTVSG